jgi:hypothetical protein
VILVGVGADHRVEVEGRTTEAELLAPRLIHEHLPLQEVGGDPPAVGRPARGAAIDDHPPPVGEVDQCAVALSDVDLEDAQQGVSIRSATGTSKMCPLAETVALLPAMPIT